MTEFSANILIAIIASAMIAPAVFFASSIIYLGFRFPRGTLVFLLKTLAVGLTTVPVALIVTLLFFLRCTQIIWTRIYNNFKKKYIANKNSSKNIDSPEDAVVHLVHGTFAADAAWTQPESSICKAISAKIPKLKQRIFSWSGTNTHKARQEAAEFFAESIQSSQSNQHYVIAHSHAGNIVREAYRINPHIAQKIQGVCLLSTPFIFRQSITRTGSGFIIAHSLGFSMVAQIPLALVLVPLDLYGSIAASISTLIISLIEIKFSRDLHAQLEDEITREQNDANFQNFQILHAIGDEADSLLRFVTVMHECCFGLFSQLQTTARQMSGRIAPYLVTLCVLAVATTATWLFEVPSPWVWTSAMALVAVGVALAYIKEKCAPSRDEPTVLLLTALPVGFISFWLAAAKSIAYGDWRLLWCPSIFVCSSETPLGDTNNLKKYPPLNDGMLVHATHSHKAAIADVAEWLYTLEERPQK